MKCGKPPPIRLWFSPCVSSYGHGGDCQFDPLPALTEAEVTCGLCGNDRAAWDRLLLRVQMLESQLEAMGPTFDAALVLRDKARSSTQLFGEMWDLAVAVDAFRSRTKEKQP